jgi:tetratricopeptide (TPR) repeat protein
MRNIAMALGVGVLAFAILYAPGFLNFGESLVPGLLAAVAAYVVLARRTFRRLEAIFAESAQVLQSVPPKFDLAVSTIQKAYALAPYQLGIRSQVDAQIGVIYFLQKDFNKAQPYLQRSLVFGHWLAGAMLGVIQYKKKDYAEMRKTFGVVTKRAKKQGIVWNLYAYLLVQLNEKDAAMRVLTDGLKHTGDDARVKDSLLALQNGKKLKMRAYKEQWYQFHLERPPIEYSHGGGGMGGKMSKIARRGRW